MHTSDAATALATPQAPVRVDGDDDTGRRVIATRDIAPGEVLADLREAHRTPVKSRFTVQIGPDAHIDGLWQFTFLNHSCDPSVHVDTTAMEIRALRAIAAGEELGYFYPSTEWMMAEPFDCHCGTPACIGRVTGAKELPPQVLGRYVVNRHIAEMKASA
ncbi:MAG: SET domain-containing protein [Gemmatimonadetes bacterium]|nr:SET domain-containing protein [Gemmatimonadota bacterium]